MKSKVRLDQNDYYAEDQDFLEMSLLRDITSWKYQRVVNGMDKKRYT